MLQPGDFLIPEISFQYSLEIKVVSPWSPGCFWRKEYSHVVCIRWDISEDRKPILKNKGSAILILRSLSEELYEQDSLYGGEDTKRVFTLLSKNNQMSLF